MEKITLSLLVFAIVAVGIFYEFFPRATAQIAPDKLDEIIMSDSSLWIFAKDEYKRGRFYGWWFDPNNGYPAGLQSQYERKYPNEPTPSVKTMYSRLKLLVEKEVALR